MPENFAALTDTGKMRSNNEDAFVLEESADKRFVLAAVIDGVGGYNGGEVAAAMAKEELQELAGRIRSADPSILLTSFRAANLKIFEAKTEGPYQEMACVLTAVIVDTKENRLAFAHLGDTRLYLYRDGSLVKITHDDSFVGLLEDTNRISEQEALNHPKRNEINKALGFEISWSAPDHVETGESPFLPGDLVMLCSDGLTDMLNRSEITTILDEDTPLDEKAKALVAAANEKGGKDNITVALVRNTNTSVKQEPVKGQRTEPETIESFIEKNKVQPAKPTPKKRGSKKLLPLLLLLIIVIVWFVIFSQKDKAGDAVESPPFTDFIALNDTLANASGIIFLSPAYFKDTVLLDSTVWLQQDTLVISGAPNRTVLISMDTASLQLAPSMKLLTFLDLELNNIHIQVSASRKDMLHFNNVRLKNVKLGVGQPLVIADTVFTGSYSTLQPGAREIENQQ